LHFFALLAGNASLHAQRRCMTSCTSLATSMKRQIALTCLFSIDAARIIRMRLVIYPVIFLPAFFHIVLMSGARKST
jgi:hypothetical protein